MLIINFNRIVPSSPKSPDFGASLKEIILLPSSTQQKSKQKNPSFRCDFLSKTAYNSLLLQEFPVKKCQTFSYPAFYNIQLLIYFALFTNRFLMVLTNSFEAPNKFFCLKTKGPKIQDWKLIQLPQF